MFFKKFITFSTFFIDFLQLEAEPNSSFERLVVCEADEVFILSSANLEAVEKILHGLQNQLKANVKYSDSLRHKIGVLFDKLELSGKEMFLAAHKGFTKMVIEEVIWLTKTNSQKLND